MDTKMFDWFKNDNAEPVKETASEQETKKPDTILYRIGVTDTNRVSFQMGYTEITMNKQGVDNLIRQLAVFRDQLEDINPEEGERDSE